MESITFSQVMLDNVFYSVDIEMKKKQLLHQLGDLKLSPAVDDKVRKQIKDIKEEANFREISGIIIALKPSI